MESLPPRNLRLRGGLGSAVGTYSTSYSCKTAVLQEL